MNRINFYMVNPFKVWDFIFKTCVLHFNSSHRMIIKVLACLFYALSALYLPRITNQPSMDACGLWESHTDTEKLANVLCWTFVLIKKSLEWTFFLIKSKQTTFIWFHITQSYNYTREPELLEAYFCWDIQLLWELSGTKRHHQCRNVFPLTQVLHSVVKNPVNKGFYTISRRTD